MSEAVEILVFAGPSLPPSARPLDQRLAWRPPARAGDALEIDARQARTVVLLDGLFDASPAIRHKELLLLMSRGVGLVGAASMGALRAAELDGFGMIGVGLIYRAFASGQLTRDDEVALLHGPGDMAWQALTEPLVNVRATLVAAVRGRILGPAVARRLRDLAAGIFYQDRTWPLLLERAPDVGLTAAEVARLQAWLPDGRVDLKQSDALEAIRFALGWRGPGARPPPPATTFTAELERQLPFRPAID